MHPLGGTSAGDGEVAAQPAQPVFFYDLGNPECYLAAERIMAALPIVPEWEPVLERSLATALGELDRAQFAQRLAAQGLQTLKWPARWPADTHTAMLTATYAKQIGRAVAFSLAAFRQAFAGGRDLADENTVLLAAAACEMHPTAVLKGIGLRSVRDGLSRANARAQAAGVRALPAVQVGEHVFSGADVVEEAAQALSVGR